MKGWLLHRSAAFRESDSQVSAELKKLADGLGLYICPVGELEQLYSARSAHHYDVFAHELRARFKTAAPPPDVFERALRLQQDLAHRHGLWHRMPVTDLLIAETACYHGFGVVHVESHFDRIAKVRKLPLLRLGHPISPLTSSPIDL